MSMQIFNKDGTMNPKDKVIHSYEEIGKKVRACRELGARIVVTVGAWDMLHIGHVRYIIQASSYGDVLIVGVDSDVSIRQRKGPGRPIIPQGERLEMVSYLSHVNVVTLITDVDKDGTWHYGLLDAVHPDVFISVEDSSSPEGRREIRKRSGNLIVLPRQAEDTSSTDIMERLIKVTLLGSVTKGRRGHRA